MANESKEAPAKQDAKSGKATPVRWAWIGLSVVGLLVPLVWLGIGSLGAKRDSFAPASPSSSSSIAQGGRPSRRLDSLTEGEDQPAPQDAPAAPSAPAPAPTLPQQSAALAPPAPPPAEPMRQANTSATTAPSTGDVKTAKMGHKGGRTRAENAKPDSGHPAKPMADPRPSEPAARRPASHGADDVVAAGPPGPPAPGAPAPPPPAEPPKPPASKQARPSPAKPSGFGSGSGKSSQRGLDILDDTQEEAKRERSPSHDVEREKAPHKGSKETVATKGKDAGRGEGIGLGKLGTIGHGVAHTTGKGSTAGESPDDGRTDRAGAKKKQAPKRGKTRRDPTPETAPAPEPEGGEEDADVASLKPGWFGTKIPNPMNLHQPTNVYVTVTREENKTKGRAKLEAMPATTTPAKIAENDILVGKFLRVEMRALPSEFEIQAISSSEQRLIAGKVTTWQWKVVPLQPGSHELSVVVTNLTDVKGQPIDLTVQSVVVEVQADTMHKLKSVGSLLSSAMGGLMSLFGMYKGVIAPLLARRREKDGDKDKDKDKDGKGKGAPPPPEPSTSDSTSDGSRPGPSASA